MNPTPSRSTRRRGRRLFAAGATAALLAVTAACSGDDDAAETTPPTEPVETTEAPTTTRATTTTSSTTTTLPPTTTTEAVIPRMPLTGEVLEEGQEVPDRPALVVKIDNNRIARPQSGLNEADIVFEEVVEFGTRFAAVFHSRDANPVGPIRSGRTQDIDLLGGLNRPLFAWSGGNANVNRAIAESDFVDLHPAKHPGLYRRQGSNPRPHNFYSTTAELFAATPPDHPGRPTQLFAYLAPDERPGGTTVARAEFNMDANRVLWEFSPEINGWLRATDGRAHHDELTGDRVSATNVVILETGYRPSVADARSPEAITIGGGRAWVLSGGKLREGAWLRDKRTDGFALFDPDGDVIELLPGRTWVELFDPADGTPSFG
jgi:hypothetical protein